MSSSGRAPLFKQVIGAVVGGALALVIYAGYSSLEPQFENFSGVLVTPQARLGLNPQGDVRIASTDIEEEQISRIASRTRQIANEFSNVPVKTVEEAPEAPVVMPEELAVQELVEDIEQAWEEEQLEFTETEPDFYGETEQLPDSGIGVWLASVIALAGATYLLCRKKFADCAQQA